MAKRKKKIHKTPEPIKKGYVQLGKQPASLVDSFDKACGSESRSAVIRTLMENYILKKTGHVEHRKLKNEIRLINIELSDWHDYNDFTLMTKVLLTNMSDIEITLDRLIMETEIRIGSREYRKIETNYLRKMKMIKRGESTVQIFIKIPDKVLEGINQQIGESLLAIHFRFRGTAYFIGEFPDFEMEIERTTNIDAGQWNDWYKRYRKTQIAVFGDDGTG